MAGFVQQRRVPVLPNRAAAGPERRDRVAELGMIRRVRVDVPAVGVAAGIRVDADTSAGGDAAVVLAVRVGHTEYVATEINPGAASSGDRDVERVCRVVRIAVEVENDAVPEADGLVHDSPLGSGKGVAGSKAIDPGDGQQGTFFQSLNVQVNGTPALPRPGAAGQQSGQVLQAGAGGHGRSRFFLGFSHADGVMLPYSRVSR